jgi:hypothetical protein
MPSLTLCKTLIACAILAVANVDAAPVSAPASASAPSHAPMTAGERDATRVMIRRDMFDAVTQACAKMFPTRAEQYQKAFTQWRSARDKQLKQGELLLITRVSREDAQETSALTRAEEKAIKTWQVDKLGIPMDRAPQRKDCDKITSSLESL